MLGMYGKKASMERQISNGLINEMTKDWTGNSNSIYKTLGASNHTDKERQNEDYYAGC